MLCKKKKIVRQDCALGLFQLKNKGVGWQNLSGAHPSPHFNFRGAPPPYLNFQGASPSYLNFQGASPPGILIFCRPTPLFFKRLCIQ